MDLAALEAEAFLLGNWKDFAELEEALSMPELTAVLTASRDEKHENRKFFAALKGVDLDKESTTKDERGGDPWEDMKARVFSRGKAQDSTDVVSLQGQNAKKAGFGIGAGLGYTKSRGGGW